MARVDITLGGRHYPIACDDGQEDRVRSIAAYIDDKIASMGDLPAATETHVMVMVGLMLGDELFDAQSRLKTAGGDDGRETEMAASSVASLADRLESIAARLERI